jgi:hypothetical protein
MSQRLCRCGFADAFASAERAGIGGRLSINGSSAAEHVCWFQVELNIRAFPLEWKLAAIRQLNIALYEGIAQIPLLLCRIDQLGSAATLIRLWHFCDNLGDVAATNKLFSTKAPLRYALQLLSAYAIAHKVSLELQHIAVSTNARADQLSRLKMPVP